jgi:hypothetical protein
MQRLALAIAALSSAVAAGTTGGGAVPAARAAVSAALWGNAIEVPGLGELNTGGDAQVTSVSCPSAGNAGGAYTDASSHAQGYVTQTR